MTLFKNAKGSSRASSRGMLAFLILCFGLINPCLAVELPATEVSVVSFSRLVKTKVQALGLGALVKISTVFRHKPYRVTSLFNVVSKLGFGP